MMPKSANTTSDSKHWVYRWQGGRYDSTTGLYNFRNRDYSPTLGRWVQQDPIGYIDGANLYQAMLGAPIGNVDPMGLSADGDDLDSSGSVGWGDDGPDHGQCGFMHETLWPGVYRVGRKYYVPDGKGPRHEGKDELFAFDEVFDPMFPMGDVILGLYQRKYHLVSALQSLQDVGQGIVGLAADCNPIVGVVTAWTGTNASGGIVGWGGRVLAAGPIFTRHIASEVRVIARGKGIKKIKELLRRFGGTKDGWRKMKGVDEFGQDWHWYQHHGKGRVGMKRAGEKDPF